MHGLRDRTLILQNFAELFPPLNEGYMVLQRFMFAELKELHTISSAGCAGFTAAGIKAVAGMHGLRELNLRGWMPNASLQALTALQALHGMLVPAVVTFFCCSRLSIWNDELEAIYLMIGA